jgi:SAM-dependent methyltransferase
MLNRIRRTAERSHLKAKGGSQYHWEQRYQRGGNSGPGSYGAAAEFKASIINGLLAEYGIESIIELGCGDGNQLGLLNAAVSYTGLDVSPTAIARCIAQYGHDAKKSFLLYNPSAFQNNGALEADAVLSLDVILHLIEDEVFDSYMQHLFGMSRDVVIIFSTNAESPDPAPHVRHRNFSPWVDRHAPDWTLQKTIENPLKSEDLTLADFYVYRRV